MEASANKCCTTAPGLHILGPGALGTLWAVRLASATRTSLITRLNQDGPLTLRLLESNQRHEVQLPATSVGHCQRRSPSVETLLVFTKSSAVVSAVERLRPSLSAQSRIVLFQNGLGSQMRLLDRFAAIQPEIPIMAAVTTEGANRRGDGWVIHAGRGHTLVGSLNEAARASGALDEIVALLAKSGLEVSASEDIMQPLWQKLAINCAINPMTALLNCRNGELRTHPAFINRWPALREELCKLLQQAGYPESPATLEQRVFGVMAKTAENISSMLQDVRAGRPTEIDDINGFAWRYLADRGLPCAMNHELWKQVSELSNG